MLMIIALVIGSFVVISSAQSEPSPQCEAAYATFNSSTSCLLAYFSLVIGNATDQEQMMVCDEGQECNTLIEDVINLCGDTIDAPTRTLQTWICSTGPNGDNCFTLIDNFDDDIFEMVATSCFGCTDDCMQTLMQLNDSLGCCTTELLVASVNLGEITDTQATVITNAFPAICGYEAFPLCNGSTLPPTECSDATIDFFSVDDECTRAVQGIINGNFSAIIGLYYGDCPTRFLNYTTACNDYFDDDGEFMQLASAIVATSGTTNSNGTLCTEILPTLVTYDNFDDHCVIDFLLREQCTIGCLQVLVNTTEEYGCCLNSFITEFTGRSNDVAEQIEYAIVTGEIYSLCNTASGGFCNGTNPPPRTNAAQQCIDARNSFLDDDTCLDYYRSLGLRSSATEVTDAALAVCTNRTCSNRMNDYLSYIQTCRLGDFSDDFNDDDDVAAYLELVYLTGNTTCRVDSGSSTNCYASIIFNPMYDAIAAAFDDDGECASLFEGTCSQGCMTLFTQAYNNLGCCLGEYGRVELGDTYLELLSRLCNVPLNTRCSNITPPTDIGGAVKHKGLGMLVVLLGVIAIVLS